MKSLRSSLLAVQIVAAILFAGFAPPGSFKYPSPRKGDVSEVLHGTTVADPYRWMEDQNSPELKEWIEEENALTSGYLGSSPEREKLTSRLKELWNYPRTSVPFRQGTRYFYSKNNGLQNQSVVFMQERLDAEPSVVIDPNTLSTDGTVALTNQSYSFDGTLLAYGLSRSGSDWQEIRIRRLDSGKDENEVLRRCRFSGIGWNHDNSGFYYDRFPDSGTVARQDENSFNRVYWHAVGTPQSEDKLVYERPDAKELNFYPSVTDDGKLLFLTVTHGTDPENRIYYRNMDSDGPFVRLLDKADAHYSVIDNDGRVVYVETNLGAPQGRVIAVDLDRPDPPDWKEIIPEQPDVISSVALIDRRFVVSTLHDAYSQLKVYSIDGSFIRTVELPTIGSVGGLSGKKDDPEMFFSFTSFVYPTVIYRLDMASNTLAPFREPHPPFDPSLYETKQVFCTSKDGTKIPVFLTSRKGIPNDGNNPVLLYGYGGFNINMTPAFQPWRIVWLERGGIYGLAVLRGGNEYGEEWHKAGMLANKQNVFDDFMAASRWLVDNKVTQPSRLAIMGGSNGGLLVSACMLQQPSLFGAVICQVPVTDMLRYHKFTVGRYWTGEYGNAEENADQFRFMMSYSPLHNVRPGVAYPPTLITTADHDDRVVPSHAMKFAATLQAADGGSNPILIRIDTKAGHGGGKPTSKQIEEISDIFTFLFRAFGIPAAETH